MSNYKDIQDFVKEIDGITEETAAYYLEMCDGNINEAKKLYYELHGVKENKDTSPNEVNNLNPVYDDFVRAPDKHFHQALIHDMDESNFLFHNDINRNKKKIESEDDTLAKLFSPPKELNFQGTFSDARKLAKTKNKYLIVNIQNNEFDSMKLNRDIWNNETIQEIIKDFFILWIREDTDQEALSFMHTYMVHTVPYICVLCKRTGRQLKIWNIKQFQDCVCAQSQLYEFIEMIETKNTNLISSTNSNSNSDVNNINYINKIEIENEEISKKNKIENENEQKNCFLKNEGVEFSKKEYNKINNELSELHKLRMQRLKKN